MSDDGEYYSDDDNNQENDDSVGDESSPIQTIFKKVIGGKKSISLDDADEDDADEDDADEDDDDLGAGIDKEDGEVTDDDEADDDESVDDDEIDINEDGENENIIQNKSARTLKPTINMIHHDEDDDDEEYDDENYLQKFDNQITKNYVNEFHPECFSHNYEEIARLSVVVKNSDGIIIDPLHRTIPYLTKYERARIIGQRAKQIESGSRPFVKLHESIIESQIIAELELREKKIPFIIRRPIPGGGSEYWNIRDLEQIIF